MSAEYDVSESTRRLLEEKAKRRLFLREQFLKLKSDPFRHASNEGGTVFDPALQRYQAMKINTFEFFRPTSKNALIALAFLVIPVSLSTYCMHTSRSNAEHKYRTGEVAYKDRRFKFI
ncbi:unnamed protein product [Phaedon cochleariae]|uniref:NADH dehydrogenase [ubiquinone] 1 beta subcomplex subunit 4 n=1 Tax=Phaedon cochleariae TaxID=80249 RepID=A0A9N9X2A3_PHACE|nr:unnamed protein product [Phaedon cochleariae]